MTHHLVRASTQLSPSVFSPRFHGGWLWVFIQYWQYQNNCFVINTCKVQRIMILNKLGELERIKMYLLFDNSIMFRIGYFKSTFKILYYSKEKTALSFLKQGTVLFHYSTSSNFIFSHCSSRFKLYLKTTQSFRSIFISVNLI